MNKLAKLLDLVESFYRKSMGAYALSKAAAEPYTYVSPDNTEDYDTNVPNEPSAYNDLVQVAHAVSDSELASELLLISEMYKKALELNNGWNTVYRGISALMNISLDDENNPEQEKVEEVLNDVVRDLRSHAGGPGALNKADSPEVVAQLKKLKNEFNARTIQEEMSHGEETGEAPEGASVVLDPFEGSGEGGKGRGYSFTQRKTPKDWAQSYENEKQRYIDKLGGNPDTQIKDTLKSLFSTLDALRTKTSDALQKAEQIAITPDADNEEEKKSLSLTQKEIEKLQKLRRALKAKIRHHELGESIQQLKQMAPRANEKEANLIKEEIALYELMRSKDVGKGPERFWRLKLIKALPFMSNTPQGIATIDNLRKNIAEAASKKTDYKKWTKENYIKQERGLGSIKGANFLLKERLASLTRERKKVVDNKLKKDQKLLSLQQAVADAHQAFVQDSNPTNQTALESAKTTEANYVTQFKNNHPQILAAKNGIAPVYDFKNQVNKIEDQELSFKELVPETMQKELARLVKLGEDSIPIFENFLGKDYYKIPSNISALIAILKGYYES